MSEGILKYLVQSDDQKSQEKTIELSQKEKILVGRIHKNYLNDWIYSQAFKEYDMAGPDEEETARRTYFAAKKNRGDLLNARSIAYVTASDLVRASAINQKRKTNGEFLIDHVEIPLGKAPIWGALNSILGLKTRLGKIVQFLASNLTQKAFGVKHVKFTYHKKMGEIRLERLLDLYQDIIQAKIRNTSRSLESLPHSYTS